MENCLIIINRSAGGSKNISFDYVKNTLGRGFNYPCHTIPTDGEPNLDGYSTLAVCGGDGTLSNVLGKVYDKNKSVYYFPSGTLNDKAKIRQSAKSNESAPTHAVIGKIAGDTQAVFSYVFAAGSFTPIGDVASVKMKKRFGVLAYLSHVISEYKIHRIHAKIQTNESVYTGDFTLIMFLKSPRCFGFKFNKAYDESDESGHMLLIRSPRHSGLLGKIEMFFPFFRVFFLGLKKERDGKIVFKKVDNVSITLDKQTAFCKDGEKEMAEGDFTLSFEKTECNLNLVHKTKTALYHSDLK